MAETPSPFGNPSELRAAEEQQQASSSRSAPFTALTTVPGTGPDRKALRTGGENDDSIESPFEDENVMARKRVTGSSARSGAGVPSDVAAARSLSNLQGGIEGQADNSNERSRDEDDDEEAEEQDAFIKQSIELGSRADPSSSSFVSDEDDDEESITRQRRRQRRKGKARATSRAGEGSGFLSQVLGLGRKVARRVEKEREQMGLGQSQSSLPSHRSGGPVHSSDGAGSVALFDADEEQGEGAPRGSQDTPSAQAGRSRGAAPPSIATLSPRDRALWLWANVDDLDAFLSEAYAYYLGKGVVCIALSRVLNLVTVAFVIGFSTFLFGCVDYSKIRHDGKLGDVVIRQCFSRFSIFTKLAYLLFGGFFLWQVSRFVLGLPRLRAMHHFYTYLLDIPDVDVASISWNEVVNRLSALREQHPMTSLEPPSSRAPSKASAGTSEAADKPHRMDAHDVANRIMRRENYLIALFNKDVLDIGVPFAISRIPLLRHFVSDEQSSSAALTRSLQWNLQFCLLDFLFDDRGQVRKQFVTDRHRKDLIAGLRRRFFFMAVLNGIFAPFIVMYLVVYSFLRYFEEYHKDPSNLGSRQYTEFARWKFREFNELPHLFKRRCYRSYPHAQRYINQFPKERTAIAARFVAFVAGSFTAVLVCASIIDPDLFLHFDITPQRNVLFYVGVFGAITAIARGMIPEEHLVFEPDATLREVIDHTHYMPPHWRGNFHSAEVHAEFGALYPLKVSIFFSELLSVILTPFILWLSLPRSAPAIIDFFKEFTVHVDGLGHVCSFAVFNFERHGNVNFGAPAHTDDQRMTSKEGKMEQSILGFKATHPDWQPQDPSATLYLARMADDLAGSHPRRTGESRESKPATSGPAFTPVNSILAARSQLYEDAFVRSITLARGANASALAASAMKSGPRSNRTPALLQAVEESQSSLDMEYEDATAPPQNTGVSSSAADADGISQQAGVRGMLDHIYQGTNAGGKW